MRRRSALCRITLTSRDENNAVIASGTYGNIDAAVLDARHSLMDPWFRRAPGLVTVLSSDLLLKVNLPKVNALSQTNPNTELLAAQLIVSQKDRRPADGLCPGHS